MLLNGEAGMTCLSRGRARHSISTIVDKTTRIFDGDHMKKMRKYMRDPGGVMADDFSH